MNHPHAILSRRALIGSAFGAIAAVASGASARSFPDPGSSGSGAARRSAVDVAREGLSRHGDAIASRDVVGIADFAAPSRERRFHLVDLESGRIRSHLVSHGRGSDPAHSGWAERFSNEFGSNASSTGAYRTDSFYSGRHGRSQRLIGLDPSNSNALARAIVIHGAWYVSDEIVRQHGKLGRSEGCFAFDESGGSLDEVLGRLGPGRLLYAGRFGIA